MATERNSNKKLSPDKSAGIDYDKPIKGGTELQKILRGIGIEQELNNKRSAKFNEHLRESEEITKSIAKLNVDLDKKYTELSKQKQEQLDLENEIADLQKEGIDNSDLIQEKQEKLVKTKQESNKLEYEYGELSKEHSKTLEEQEKKYKEIKKTRADDNVRETEDLYKRIDDKLHTISDKTKDMFDVGEQANRSKQTYINLSEIENKLLSGNVNENSKLLSVTNLMKHAVKENAIEHANMLQDVDKTGISSARLLDIEEQKVASKRIENLLNDEDLKIELSKLDNGDEILKNMQDELALINQTIESHEKINQTIEQGKTVSENVTGGITKTFDVINTGLSMVPGGDKIANLMGLDKLEKRITTQVGDSMTNAFTKAGGGMKGAFAAGGAGASSMLSTLMGPAGMMIGIGLIVGAIGGIISKFGEADKAVSEMQKTMEVSKKEAVAMQGAAIDLAADINMVGINSAEVMKTMGGLREAFGGMRIDPSTNPEMKMLVEQGTMLGEKFGISAQETKDLYSQSKILGVSMEEMTATAATFGDKTIGSKEALKEMAALPKSITVGFKGTVKQLAAATVKAKMMGTTLEAMRDIGDGMLDIESSLNNEMEARILTGKNINLDRARELALSGDVAGLQDEVLEQMGSMEDFKKMDVMAQQSMAKAMGMSVDEMTNMLSKAEENKALGIDSVKMKELEAASSAELNKMAENATGPAAEAYATKLKGMAAEKESATLQEKIANIMTKIQERITKAVLPLVEMASAFMDSAAGGQLIDEILSTVGDTISWIGGALQPVLGLFSKLGDIIGSLQKHFGILKMLLPIILVPLGLIGVSMAYNFAMWVTQMAIEKAKMVQDKVMQGVMLLKSAATWAYNAAMSGGIVSTIAMTVASWGLNASFLANPVVLIVVGIMALVGAIIYAYKNFEGFREVVDNLWDTMKNLFSSFIDGVAALWDLIKPLFDMNKIIGIVTDAFWFLWDIFIMIAKFSPFGLIIQGLMFLWDNISSIGSGITGIFTTVTDIIDSVMGKIDKVIGLAKSAIGFISGLMGSDDESEEAEKSATSKPSGGSPVTPKATGGKITSPTGYTLVGEGGPELVQLPQASNVVNAAATGGMMNGEQTSISPKGSSSGDMTKVIEVLQQILAVASQPALLQLGDKFVQEMDSKIQLRAGMRVNTDNTWGKNI